MINSLDGPVLLNDAFGALLSYNLSLMLNYVEKPKVCGDKVEYGIPFFDDLDAIEKAVSLHGIAVSMFDSKSPILKETAYHVATFAALENHMKAFITTEIDTRHWSKKKYGEESCILRALIIAAFKSRYPRVVCLAVGSTEAAAFAKMIGRLMVDIKPQPYFLMADVSSTKRNHLMKRLAIPSDYFAPLNIGKTVSKKDKQEKCQTLLADARSKCLSMLTHWLQTDRTPLAAMIAKELKARK
jgi:hypothetical protein